MSDAEYLPLADELCETMRRAAGHAKAMHEPFISARALLLALLDDPAIGAAVGGVVPRDRLASLPPAQAQSSGVTRVTEQHMEDDEQPAIVRYNTLAWKVADGPESVWLDADALRIFIEGAQRVEGTYATKHLALGFAADAVRMPGVLSAIRIEPGRLADAVYKL